MTIHIRQIPVGQMQNYAYVAYDEQTRAAVIIDPSWDLDKIEDAIRDDSIDVKYIINTHHHFDHTTGNDQMKKSTGALIAQHAASGLDRDVTLNDGDTIRFGNSSLLVLHTPGHSKDSICLVGDGKIFTGDTLFVGTCGRVDLPGGDPRDLYHSIFDVLYKLDENLIMYPGHNYGYAPTSTIGEQKQNNPVMQQVSEEQFVARMTMG